MSKVVIPNQFEFKNPPIHKFLIMPLGLMHELGLNTNDALVHAYLVDCLQWSLSVENHKRHLYVDSNGEVFAKCDTRVIRKSLQISYNTFNNSRKKLLKVGLLPKKWIRVPDGGNMVNAYYVLTIDEFLKKYRK
jgi:hypothetical protein